jgi:hypothetical protein
MSNVVPLHRPVAINRNHPSCQPARRDVPPLALYQRQVLASELTLWKSTPPTAARIDAVIAVLLGTDDGTVGAS